MIGEINIPISAKKCPFCKTKKYLVMNTDVGDFFNGFISRIKCKKCGCTQTGMWSETEKDAQKKVLKHGNKRK